MSANLFKIGTPTRARLAHYRDTCARLERGNRDNWRRYVHHDFLAGRTFSVGENGERFTNNIEDIGEYLGDSETIAKNERFDIKIYGYFTDNDARDTYIPGVSKPHTARGCLFIPTIRHSDWSGTTHYVRDAVFMHDHDTRSAIREALDIAHAYASRKAEEEREHDAKFQAEQQTENAREEIATIAPSCGNLPQHYARNCNKALHQQSATCFAHTFARSANARRSFTNESKRLSAITG